MISIVNITAYSNTSEVQPGTFVPLSHPTTVGNWLIVVAFIINGAVTHIHTDAGEHMTSPASLGNRGAIYYLQTTEVANSIEWGTLDIGGETTVSFIAYEISGNGLSYSSNYNSNHSLTAVSAWTSPAVDPANNSFIVAGVVATYAYTSYAISSGSGALALGTVETPWANW